MEDFLLFQFRSFPFSVSLILADSVSIRDPIVRVSFNILSFISSSFLHLLDTNLSFSRALLLLYGSEYIGNPSFALWI